jgi:hypothetical protein
MFETIIETIVADGRPIYQILVTNAGSYQLRHVDKPRDQVDLIPSVIPMLIDALRKTFLTAKSS